MEIIKVGRMVERCAGAITVGNHLNIWICKLDGFVELHVVSCLAKLRIKTHDV
jgi:hypothetical protein